MRIEKRQSLRIAPGLLEIIGIPKVALIISCTSDVHNDIVAFKMGGLRGSAFLAGIRASGAGAHQQRAVRRQIIEDSDWGL